MKKFWYVSRDPSTVGYHDPKTAYFNKQQAKDFAESMVKKTGHDFYVMESMELVKPAAPPVEWIKVPEVSQVKKKADRPRDTRGRFLPYLSSSAYYPYSSDY